MLTGPLFSEPMRVETVRSNGADSVEAGLVGQQTERFRRVTLTSADVADLTIADSALSYDGDGRLLRLGLQAYSLGIAHEFDPYFGLSISRVDPLPHQLEAVYEYFMKLPSVRFLLADDAGAGKTIMAGLLVRELKLRGLAERVLVVCPANLTFQWQRELKEKFDQQFLVLKGGDVRDQFGVNQWLSQKHVITSLDLAKREDILPGLRQVRWDLVIVDEAHRMSASDETHKSQRYRLGELLRDSSDNVLLLTATPHKGDPHNFTLFLQLLDQDVYADVKSIREAMERNTAEERNFEWVTPGHPLFEALRRHSFETGREAFARGACFHSLEHEAPARLDFYRARIVDGLGHVIHERLFTVELAEGREPRLQEPDVLGNLTPTVASDGLPAVASLSEPTAWLNEHALAPFIGEVRAERLSEVDRIAEHVELSLTEVLGRVDQEIGRAVEEVEKQITGAEGRLAQAEARHDEAMARRERRRRELTQQRALTLQGVERLASVLVLPHPEIESDEVRRLRPSPETEMTAMQVVMDYEAAQGRQVDDVHEKNLGYDVRSLDVESGEQRLIEVKGLAAPTGAILLTPNERRVAEDRRDCYWLYVVTNCAAEPQLQEPTKDPARFPWHEVSKVQHYWLQVDAMTSPMQIRAEPAPNAEEGRP